MVKKLKVMGPLHGRESLTPRTVRTVSANVFCAAISVPEKSKSCGMGTIKLSVLSVLCVLVVLFQSILQIVANMLVHYVRFASGPYKTPPMCSRRI